MIAYPLVMVADFDRKVLMAEGKAQESGSSRELWERRSDDGSSATKSEHARRLNNKHCLETQSIKALNETAASRMIDCLHVWK